MCDYLDQTLIGKLITSCRTDDLNSLEQTHDAQHTKEIPLGNLSFPCPL